MPKILIINSYIHDKNRLGLIALLNHLKFEYKVGTSADIPEADVIYSPSQAINTAAFPTKKFIFGPHFSVFPNFHQLQSIQAKENSIYILPCEWTVQWWKNYGVDKIIPLKIFPFPVNTFKFQPIQAKQDQAKQDQAQQDQAQQDQAQQDQAQQDQAQQDQAQQDQAQQDQAQQDQAKQDQAAEQTQTKRENVLVYFKHRNPEELKHLQLFLAEQTIKYRLFSYDQRYQEADYIAYLQTCQYGIVLDAHESQGFAIEEALACDVPLLVWNAQTMNQEYGATYQAIPCTSIPYWDSICGEYFHTSDELPATFQTFQTKLASAEYKPRQYILDNLSLEKCAERFIALI